jgi:hypothetical protein
VSEPERELLWQQLQDGQLLHGCAVLRSHPPDLPQQHLPTLHREWAVPRKPGLLQRRLLPERPDLRQQRLPRRL